MNVIAETTRLWLTHVARQALAEALQADPGAALPRPDDPALDQPVRAFVSWHHGSRLVGCIGTLEPTLPLEATVRVYAVRAGLYDPRTPGATSDELPELSCEISVLSEPTPMDVVGVDAIRDRLVPHRDGLVLRDGTRRAVFLPVVWSDLPDPDAFVDALCRKAGIDRTTRGPWVCAERFESETFTDR